LHYQRQTSKQRWCGRETTSEDYLRLWWGWGQFSNRVPGLFTTIYCKGGLDTIFADHIMHDRLCSALNFNLQMQMRCMLFLVEASLNSTLLRCAPRDFYRCVQKYRSTQFLQACVDLRVPVICVGSLKIPSGDLISDDVASLFVRGQRDLMVCSSCLQIQYFSWLS